MVAAVDLCDGLRWMANLSQMAGVEVRLQRLLHMWRRVFLLQVTFVVGEVEILTIWQHAETTLFFHFYISREHQMLFSQHG